ncbi:MAG: hypothetical protein ACOC6K_03630 [Thermodesulfobacteriota bacterium]
MDAKEALRIIQSLIDGVDPNTGETLPPESPYQQPQVLRALFLASKSLEESFRRKLREKNLPSNAGKPWLAEEDKILSEGFEKGLSIDQLAEKHQRTKGAILARLSKIGKIPPGFRL